MLYSTNELPEVVLKLQPAPHRQVFAADMSSGTKIIGFLDEIQLKSLIMPITTPRYFILK